MVEIQFKGFSLLYGLSHFWWLRQAVLPTIYWPDLSKTKNQRTFRWLENIISAVNFVKIERKSRWFLVVAYTSRYSANIFRVISNIAHLANLLIIVWITYAYREKSLSRYVILKPGTFTTELSLYLPVVYVSI